MSKLPRLDYDRSSLPDEYDRGRSVSPELLRLWMQALRERLPGVQVKRILDLGCGTGRFSEALAGYFSSEVIGLDPSHRMLERAREKRRDARVEYLRGAAEAIPLPEAAVDLVFMSMCFHHFADSAQAATECRRVLRADGAAALRNGTRERIDEYPYVPFFPSSRAILEQILPDHAAIRAAFEAAGLRVTFSGAVKHTIAPSWAAYAERLAAGGDSVLARLHKEEIREGLASLREHGARHPGPVEESIDLFVFQ